VQPVLQLREVSKSFGEGATHVDALRQVDLVVHGGELVAIMGPSGSGKSTLLTIAGGLEQPTSGSVTIDGQDVSTASRKERSALRRKSMGFVFQDFNLLGGLTALENVAIPLELDGLSAKEAGKQAAKALARVDMTDRESHFPEDLSGGERQRVAIARSIVGERRLLLADEPTGALDSVNGEAVMRVLRSVCDDGSAVVMVTHDAHLAAWADRVVFIRDGSITSQTNPQGPESIASRSVPS
jgi:putative ABC transport system ATP-binding protein